VSEPRIRIEAYQYDGAHRNWHPGWGRIVDGYQHWDWRYKIMVDGLIIYRRSGFCSYDRAVSSLSRNLPKVLFPISAKEQE
jgi:hypothetical protein